MAPALQDQPTVVIPKEVFDLAAAHEQLWPSREQVAREAPLGLVAMAEEEEVETETGEQPASEEHPGGGDNAAEDKPDEESPSFLDEYDLGEIEDDQARGVAEAYIKRIGGAYTRQRQEDTQAVREARQSQEILQGLMNETTRPQVAAALGIPLAQANEEFGFDDEFDDEFEEGPAAEQIGALWSEIQRRDELAEADEAVQAENRKIAEGIEGLERQHGVEFSDEEIDLLTLYADEFRDGQEQPDVAAAYKVFDSVVSGRLQQMTKRKSGAPRRMGRGAPAVKEVDLDDEQQQLEAMERAVAAARESGA